MIKKITFDELVDYILDGLPFDKTISIPENPEAEECWWSMTKISIADSEALYCNLYGGGSPYVCDMYDKEKFKEEFKVFIEEILTLNINEPILIDNEEPLLEYCQSSGYADNALEALYELAQKYDDEIIKMYPTFESYHEEYKDGDDTKKYLYIEYDLKSIAGHAIVKHGVERDDFITELVSVLEKHGCKSTNRFENHIDKGIEAEEIRSDWKGALESCSTFGKDGIYSIPSKIGYGFSDSDITTLAEIHKEGDETIQTKIELLLEDCNFHEECSDFESGNYKKYLSESVKDKNEIERD